MPDKLSLVSLEQVPEWVRHLWPRQTYLTHERTADRVKVREWWGPNTERLRVDAPPYSAIETVYAR